MPNLPDSVPYIVFEGQQVLSEKKEKRLCRIIIILIALWVATIFGFVGAFLWYTSVPVESSEITIESDDGNANYIGNDMKGDINNGTSESKNNP